MERRYDDALNLRFDQIADIGFAVITRDEIMRWWGRARETPSIWADLNERWEERAFKDEEGRAIPLLIGKWGGYGYTLAWGGDWLKPISSLAVPKRDE